MHTGNKGFDDSVRRLGYLIVQISTGKFRVGSAPLSYSSALQDAKLFRSLVKLKQDDPQQSERIEVLEEQFGWFRTRPYEGKLP